MEEGFTPVFDLASRQHRRFGETSLLEIISRSTIQTPAHCVIGLLLLAAALSLPAIAQEPTGAGARHADPTAESQAVPPNTVAPSKPALADFAWLAGSWQGTWGPRVAQQIWTAPKAGVMVGTFQLAQNDKTLVLELFTLLEDSDGITFQLRHFTPSLVAWEKPGPTILKLSSVDPKVIVFENPVDGQPKVATFTRQDADTYVSRSEIVPEKGDPQVTEITYHRVVEVLPPPKPGKKKKSK
jgi:Domain of unknown function (DUF6265)